MLDVRKWLTVVAAVGAAGVLLAQRDGSPAPLRPAQAGLETLPASLRGVASAALGAADQRFAVSTRGGVLVARGDDLAAAFGRSGPSVAAGGEHVAFALTGVGYGAALAVPAPAVAAGAGNQASYRRGAVTEWYRNGPAGLEQGFTLARRPANGPGRLTVSMRLSGSLVARLAGPDVVFARSAGGPEVLRYGGLTALDAAGRELPARMELHGSSLRLAVDDRGARYPVTIDPLIQHRSKLTGAGATAAAQFGYSVALSADGQTALIGGNLDGSGAGAAWVFTRSGATWAPQGPKLTGAGATGTARFGNSVALSSDGNTALIGGPDDDAGHGAAWVFTRSGSAWTQQGAKLTGSGMTGAAQFGLSVALSADGSTALIGGPFDDSGAGSAWLFMRSGATWAESSRLDAGVPGAQFGYSVALSADGRRALIGGPADSGVGAAWLRAYPAWTPSIGDPKLTATDETAGGRFGSSAALSADGGTALIGGSDDSDGAGAAWVFTVSGDTGTQQGSKLTGGGASGAARFGASAALSADGNMALIGGSGDATDLGAAWLFTRSQGAWTQQGSKLTAADETGAGRFGSGVALAGDANTALIGGVRDDLLAGAAWVFALATTVSVGSSANPSAAGAPVTYTATVGAGTGTVAFLDGGATLAGCGAQPLVGGSATCAATHTTAGSHAITAVYSGDGTYAAATSPALTQTVDLTPTPTPTSPTRSGPLAGTLMLACSAFKLGLTNALVRGSRVSLAGVADLSLAGRRATILLAGSKRSLATVVVRADGTFSTSVRAPGTARARAGARYLVTIGTQRSSTLPLARRLVVEPPSYAAGIVTIAGRAVAPLSRPPAAVVIQRRIACGRLVTVATVKPASSGRFRVTLTAPAGERAAVYSATTRVLERARGRVKIAAPGLAQVVALG